MNLFGLFLSWCSTRQSSSLSERNWSYLPLRRNALFPYLILYGLLLVECWILSPTILINLHIFFPFHFFFLVPISTISIKVFVSSCLSYSNTSYMVLLTYYTSLRWLWPLLSLQPGASCFRSNPQFLHLIGILWYTPYRVIINVSKCLSFPQAINPEAN